jgi:hypothetical protein
MRIASNIIFPDYATDVTLGDSSDEACHFTASRLAESIQPLLNWRSDAVCSRPFWVQTLLSCKLLVVFFQVIFSEYEHNIETAIHQLQVITNSCNWKFQQRKQKLFRFKVIAQLDKNYNKR